ncbi:hypothetical protein [Tumebacillus lipolyticus]|uniref:Chromosome segregation ATPase n=1 Tax=Tumebacillus lipolyticus TaxID=1280370 RepID=A0ABW4ZWK4_9BACL
MPSINRIRLVNIQYDKGGKQYADELFKLHGKNTLFNLANGGGKTLWLQLVTQAALPGAMYGSRRMVDLLAHERYTGHILVEWKLDSFGEREFLLTGFCFTKSADEEGELKYFTYVHPYKIADEFGIVKMPLVTDGKVISYGDFYNLLRKESTAGGRKIQTFSQQDRRKYINHLMQYNIYEKEWLAIRTTNGSEGGMDGFFARSKTEQSLLENLLIPTVDQALFQDEAEAEDLAHSFLRYKDKLLRIPQIEKNLEEFRLIEEAGRNVLQKVERYSESRAQKRELEGQLTEARGRLETMAGERTEEAEALAAVVQSLKEQIREEEYKQASLDVNALQEQFRKGAWAVDALTLRLEELMAAEEEAKRQVRLFRAVPKFLQIKELEKRLARDEETLSGLDMQNEDLLTELATYRGQFLTLWNERVVRHEAELEAKREAEAKWKEVDQQADAKLLALAEGLNALSKTSGELEVWFKQYQQQKLAVTEVLGESIAEEPVSHRDDLRWKEIERTNSVRNLEAEIETAEGEIERAQQQITAAKEERWSALQEQEKIAGKIDEHEARKKRVQGRLELLDAARSDLYGAKADLDLTLAQKREGYSREYARLAAKKGAVEEKIERLSQDHYIPSQDLLYFQQVLADWGIDATLGSQWLQEQDATVREAYVRANPMLPYSLLIEDAGIKKLHDPRLDWEGLHLESLVPLFARSSLTAVTSFEGQIVKLGEDGYFSLHGGYSPFLSQESLAERRVALEAEEVDLVAKMEVVERSRRHIEQVSDELGRFFDDYPKDPLAAWQTKRESLVVKSLQAEEELDQLNGSIAELRTKISEAKRSIKEQGDRLEELRDQLRLLDPFAGLAAERKEREAEREQLKEREAALKAEQKEWFRSSQEAREQKERLLPALISLQNERIALDKEREKYLGSHQVEEAQVSAGLTYEKVQGKLDSLDDLLAQKSVGRDELVRLIQNHEESIAQNRAYIAEQSVTEEELAVFQTAPPAAELTYWEQRLQESQAEKAQVERERTDIQAEQKKLEGMIETEEKKVRKDFDRPAYAFGEAVDLGEEKAHLAKLVGQLWTERRSNESAMEETERSLQEVNGQLQKVDTLLSAYSIECEPLELSEERANKLPHEPTAVIAEIDKSLQRTSKQFEERRRELDDEFYRFERSIDKYESKIVQKFIRSVIDSKVEGDMNEIEQVRPVFEKCFEMMNLYIEKARLERQELEEAKEELVHRCLQHADRVYDNVKSIAQYTKIDYRGKKVQAIDILLKEKWEEPEGLRLMDSYLQALTEELQAKVMKGEDEDELEKWLSVKLSSKHLLNVVAPIVDTRIKVFKPQQVPGEKVRYDHWSEIMKWSGGEQYTGCFAMFIAVLSYLRAKMSGIENARKVLLADNPFGVVSSPHLLQVIFKLAQANRVQMICLSDHNKQSIYDLFEVVYSLKLIPALGRSIIQSTERRPESVMEAGYYEIDFDQEVETEQKSLPI